ncbi:hypothetical protein APF79_01435 [bacterium BRH_c32]|nr:MAG: hypothetical protein APF79_01435 [bacterium BRH_c32]
MTMKNLIIPNKQNHNKQLIYIVAIFLLANIAFAQETDSTLIPTSYINIVGRYTDGKGVELRFFPNKKSVLEVGLKNGFIIDRMLFDSTDQRNETETPVYNEIARVFPFNDDRWGTTISNEKNTDSRSELEIARDFLKNIDKKEGGAFDFEKGIAELKEQKSKEDFEYMIFALSAIKNAKVAIALGLAYTDTTVKKGETYIYRVRPIGKSNIYDIISVDYRILVDKPRNSFDNKVYVKQGDTELFFSWIEIPEISGYFVERANPGESTFIQLNEAPIYNLGGSSPTGESRSGYNDKNLINYKTYTYRFFGYTLFGEKVQFAEVKGMPKDLTPPENPFLPQPKHVKDKEVLVTWKMNPTSAPDLNGFFVARSDKNEGEFKVLHNTMLPKNSRTFIDTTFIPGEPNYYLVQAVDTANNVSSSFPVSVTLIDSIPPVKPIFISGKIDSLGVVTIIVEKNKEKDLMGYRLFRSNSEEHEFSTIYEGFMNNDSLDQKVLTEFKDTVSLNSLTPIIYYKIKALDFNYNQSEFSNVLKVVRPDTIPPVIPLFNDVIVGEKKIELRFVPSSSEDVNEHIIYRKTDLQSKWENLNTTGPKETKYVDTTVTTGTTYYYSIRAKDISGLFSKYSSTVYGKPYDTGLRPSIEKFSIDVEKKNIILKWEYPPLKAEHVFMIYKRDDKGKLQQYDTTKEKSYTDKNVNKENYYAIKVITEDGGQSKMSNVLGKNIE